MGVRRQLWPVYRCLLQRSSWPVLAGPFRGELGFEVLYWMPWLKKLGLSPERLIPITRGGMAQLYGAAGGFELYQMRTPQAIRVENNYQREKTGKLKQEAVWPWDVAVVKDAAETLKLRRYHHLHPAWMFADCTPFIEGWEGLSAFNDRVGYDKMAAPDPPPGLPKEFVAVRFYLRYTYPHHPSTVEFARAAVKQISQTLPVVLLHPGLHADDHVDLEFKGLPNVTRMTDYVQATPENNLILQAAILKRARAFVGTYGGLAQLALRLGTPSVSFYADWHGTAMAHKHLSDGLSLQMGVPFIVLRITEGGMLKAILPDIAMSSSGVRHVEPAASVAAPEALAE